MIPTTFYSKTSQTPQNQDHKNGMKIIPQKCKLHLLMACILAHTVIHNSVIMTVGSIPFRRVCNKCIQFHFRLLLPLLCSSKRSVVCSMRR